MPDADVPITAGVGTKVDTRTVGAGSDEHRQVTVVGSPVTAAAVAEVTNAAPGASDYGLIVRPIPSATATPVSASALPLPAGAATEASLASTLAGVGATADAEATGNGSLIALLKRLRTLLGGTLAVSGTFWQATQPVSGPATDAQLRATPLPVSGTVTASGPVTDAQLRAAAVPVSNASLPLPTGGTPTAGTLAATTTAQALGSLACKSVCVQADPDNAADVFLGDATSQTIQLTPGQPMSVPISNVSQLQARMASGTGAVNWLAVN